MGKSKQRKVAVKLELEERLRWRVVSRLGYGRGK